MHAGEGHLASSDARVAVALPAADAEPMLALCFGLGCRARVVVSRVFV